MRKKIAILGSTGSIGSSTLKIIKKKIKKINVILLSTKKNHNKLLKQAIEYNAKNVIIFDKESFKKSKKKFLKKKIKAFNNLKDFLLVNQIKFDFVMSSIAGIEGLQPTLDIIKNTKKIGIANKESIICGWNLINKKLKSYKTEFIPVDSEHFSIWSLIKNIDTDLVEKIFITASGGPFLNWKLNDIKNASSTKALKHPNWSMGKKISIDSATMMNKVFEVIEAQRIFNLSKKKIKILIHEKSYVHAIVKFKNGLTKMLIHDTDMQIPIFNCLFSETNETMRSDQLKLRLLNNLNFKEVDVKKFPSVNLLKKIPDKISLFDTVLISANDILVEKYLKREIKFTDIQTILKKLINKKKFIDLKKKAPKNPNEIKQLNEYVRLKTIELCI